MKTVILAGGYGTRLSELTETIPKPMVEIGGRPILWHILKTYGHFGFHEFVIALGYKADRIKDFFLNLHLYEQNITVDMEKGVYETPQSINDPWKVHLVDTGLNTLTGGRIRRVQEYVGNEQFMLTYGDGVGNIALDDLLAFHKSHGKLATVTAVRPPARFGGITLADDKVVSFSEKNQTQEGWISGGYFVLEPAVFDLIGGDETIWEKGPMEVLAQRGELMAFRHEHFWQPVDTLKELKHLQQLWDEGKAPWKVWQNTLEMAGAS